MDIAQWDLDPRQGFCAAKYRSRGFGGAATRTGACTEHVAAEKRRRSRSANPLGPPSIITIEPDTSEVLFVTLSQDCKQEILDYGGFEILSMIKTFYVDKTRFRGT